MSWQIYAMHYNILWIYSFYMRKDSIHIQWSSRKSWLYERDFGTFFHLLCITSLTIVIHISDSQGHNHMHDIFWVNTYNLFNESQYWWHLSLPNTGTSAISYFNVLLVLFRQHSIKSLYIKMTLICVMQKTTYVSANEENYNLC